MNNIDNSILINSADSIQNIASPLKTHFGITYFGYIKSHLDSTHLALSTSPKWMKCFYENFHAKAIFHKTIDAYTPGCFLWSQFSNEITINVARDTFNIAHGVIIIEKHADFCEFFGFAAHPDNYKIESWYLCNMDLLKRFIWYFKEKAKSLIKSAEGDRLILPKQSNINSSNIASNFIVSNDESRLDFLEKTALKKPYGLSKRQMECLYYLSRGMTMKQIGQSLHLSPKTIEHYLDTIKIKLNCSNRAELVKKTLEWSFHL